MNRWPENGALRKMRYPIGQIDGVDLIKKPGKNTGLFYLESRTESNIHSGVFCIGLDKLAARWNLIPHEHRKYAIAICSIID